MLGNKKAHPVGEVFGQGVLDIVIIQLGTDAHVHILPVGDDVAEFIYRMAELLKAVGRSHPVDIV